MAGRGAYQKQIAAIITAAAADSLTIDDILPHEIQEHFHDLVELKRARAYILELEGREKELQAAKETLTSTLANMRLKIDDLPTEHQARKTELQQAYRQIALHKETSDNLNQRVQRYQQQLKNTVDKRQTDDSTAKQIKELHTRVADQQAIIAKLLEDHRESEALYETIQQCDKNALELKDNELAKKDHQLMQQDDLIAQLRLDVQDAIDDKAALEELDPVALQEENIGLSSQNLSLSEDNQALQDQYDIVKEQLGKLMAAQGKDPKAQLFAAAISETKTLNRFYKAAFQVLNALSGTLHEDAKIPSRSFIENHLDAAQEALNGCRVVKDVMRAGTDVAGVLDPDQAALCTELDTMAKSAADAMISIETLHNGFWEFLNQLSDDPKLLSELNYVLCESDRVSTVNMYSCV